MNIDITLDEYFNLKGYGKKHWGGNALIYVKESNVTPFKSEVFSVVNSLGMLHQVSFGIYFKELTELSYQLFRKIKPQFGEFEEKRMVACNFSNCTYSSIKGDYTYNSIKFKDDKESSKYEKLFNFYEEIVEPFFNKFQKVEDFKYLYTNADKLGESDLLALLYLSKIYSPDKQNEIIALLDAWYEKKLSKAKTERRKSIVLELIANTEKRKEFLNALP